MAKDFVYFAGTLPMLFFGETPPMTLTVFDEDAARLMDSASAEALRQITLCGTNTDNLPEPLRKFYDWENALRNSWLEVRKKNRPDAPDFKRGNPDFHSEIMPALTQAAGCSDLLQAEKIIDQLRWNALDSLTVGHYSDFTFLAFYRLKLEILEKYITRTASNGNQALENILTAIMDSNKIN